MKGWMRVALLCALPLGLSAQEAREMVIVSQPVGDDFYGAGRRVEIRAPVDGDATVAGQTVNITAPVKQDVMAAGGSVVIGAPVGDDVRVAGGDVRIESSVTGHLLAAGGAVTVLPGASIGGFAWLYGRDLDMEGDVGGDLKATGETVRIAGHVKGNVSIRARRLELLPGARIDGNLTWSGVEKRFDEGSTVSGRIIEVPRPPEEEHHLAKVIAFAGAMLIIAYVIAGVVLYLLFPRVADATAATIRRMPWLDLALGFAVLILTPVLIVLLFATAVGWLLALILLALYLVALPVSALIGTYALFTMATNRWRARISSRGWRTLFFAIAIIIVSLLHFIPVLGWIFGFWLMLWGLGALLLSLYHTVSRTEEYRPV